MNKNEFEEYLRSKSKKHIIFDFDQTLCDLLINWDDWAKEMKALYLSFRINLDPEKHGHLELQNMCVEKYGDEARDKILEINYRNEKDCSLGYKLLPATISILSLAKNLARLYIWSSNDRLTIKPILDEVGVEKLFSKIITRNDVTYVKPNPEGFYLIYNKNNPKSEYLMIGDSQADEKAAKEAGIDFLKIADLKDISQ
ncbi:MAG: HAD-IA family hydrolase [Parcubacteria group bacterium]|jgi:phosphoglycolate phosphatase